VVLKLSDAWSWTAEADNLVRVARELVKRGHTIVIGCSPDVPLAARAKDAGLDVRTLPGLRTKVNPLAFVRGARAVRALLEDVDPDVVHAYRSPVHVLAALALRGRLTTRLVRTRGTMESPRGHFLNRALYDRATDLTIVTAEAVRLQCLEAGFDPRRLVTVHGAIELERFDPAKHDKPSAKERLGIPREAPVVGQLARLAPIKGHRWMLEAAKRLFEKRPDAWLVLVGPAWPGMEEAVRAQARELGIERRVVLTGKVDDVAGAIAAFDVGVVASVGSEALSRAALEYLAMGIPIVATRVGSLPELVDDGKTGLLVPPMDSRALADAIASLLDEPERRDAFARAAREAALGRFGIDALAGRLESLYRDLTARRVAGALAP
jgi:glycosyltransferase involved in cell wall biosynthesis